MPLLKNTHLCGCQRRAHCKCAQVCWPESAEVPGTPVYHAVLGPRDRKDETVRLLQLTVWPGDSCALRPGRGGSWRRWGDSSRPGSGRVSSHWPGKDKRAGLGGQGGSWREAAGSGEIRRVRCRRAGEQGVLGKRAGKRWGQTSE